MKTEVQMRRGVFLLLVAWVICAGKAVSGASTSHDSSGNTRTRVRHKNSSSFQNTLSPLSMFRRGLDDGEEQQNSTGRTASEIEEGERNYTEGIVTAKESYDESDLSPEEQDALWRFFNATRLWSSDKQDWFDSGYKLEDDKYNYCLFTGIECKAPKDDNRDAPRGVVVKIILRNKALSGMLPEDVFSALPRLTTLHMASNKLQGPIPQSLVSLSELRDLDLSKNELSGGFPSLNTTAPVRRIMLQQNQLEGKLHSTSLCPFQELKALDISGNEAMHGPIPDCLGSFEDLEEFKFDGVGFTGDIPAALCDPDREMNGFEPNDEYGCDAIACPVGTYEPTLGRQEDKSTACRPCPNWPTNYSGLFVLGATACPDEGEHRTLQPTGSPTKAPDYATTPTLAPTLNSTYSGSSGDQSTHTFTPSAGPSEAINGPNNVSGLVWNDEMLIVEVVLADVHRVLDIDEEVSIMQSLTRTFLQGLLEEEDVVILKLAVTRQQQVVHSDEGFFENRVSKLNPPSRQLLVADHPGPSSVDPPNQDGVSSSFGLMRKGNLRAAQPNNDDIGVLSTQVASPNLILKWRWISTSHCRTFFHLATMV